MKDTFDDDVNDDAENRQSGREEQWRVPDVEPPQNDAVNDNPSGYQSQDLDEQPERENRKNQTGKNMHNLPGIFAGEAERFSKVFFPLAIGIVVIIILVFIFSKPIEHRITKWADNKDYGRLDNFLLDNTDWQLKDSRKADAYLFAFQEALKLDANRYGKLFLELYAKTDIITDARILQAVCSVKQDPAVLSALLFGQQYVEKTRDHHDIIRNALELLDPRIADSLLVAGIGSIEQYYSVSHDSMMIATRYPPKSIEYLGDIMYSYSSFAYQRHLDFNTLKSYSEELTQLADSIEALDGDLLKAPEVRDSLQKEIASAQADAQRRERDSFILDFYVVSEEYFVVGYGSYEIVTDLWSTASRHDKLWTRGTRFTQMGRASLRVSLLGRQEAKTNERAWDFSHIPRWYLEHNPTMDNETISRKRTELSEHDSETAAKRKKKASHEVRRAEILAGIQAIMDKYCREPRFQVL
jgi:hypothetical protein